MIGLRPLLVAMLVFGAGRPHASHPSEDSSRTPVANPVERDSTVQVAPDERLAVRLVGTPPTATDGRTPRIVILPGTVGSAFSMRHVTAVLAARGQPVIIVDPLGMGRSAHPARADYSLTAQARRISAVLESLGVGRALLVAQGTSATLALRLAADRPEQVSGVISLAGGPIDRQETAGVRLALALAPLLDTPLGRAIGRRRFLAAVRAQSADPAWCTPDVAAHYLAPVESDLRGTLRTLRAMHAAVEPTRIEHELRRVRAPVHLLVGDHPNSHAPTIEQVAMLQRHLAAFHVDTVARAGTMLHEERADTVAAAVLAMLDRTRSPH
jgi:pimeloyl-ACP methyl ester carboxylesterase